MQTDIEQLFEQQLQSWPLAVENYAALKNIRIKSFDFGAYKIKVQFNPARVVSTAAKTDKKSIEKRPCFLCAANRPKEQQEIEFKGKYDILVNPFPICDKHLTIALKEHQPQEILPYVEDMLDLAYELPEYLILYNGPQSGASAPDHFHFQAGNIDFFDNQIDIFQEGLIEKELIVSDDKKLLEKQFIQLYKELQSSDEEPMMNLFCQYKAGKWELTVYPRKKHRPEQYYDEGIRQIMISPGAIDMTGVLIVPREEDFNKITKEDIQDIFKQV